MLFLPHSFLIFLHRDQCLQRGDKGVVVPGEANVDLLEFGIGRCKHLIIESAGGRDHCSGGCDRCKATATGRQNGMLIQPVFKLIDKAPVRLRALLLKKADNDKTRIFKLEKANVVCLKIIDSFLEKNITEIN